MTQDEFDHLLQKIKEYINQLSDIVKHTKETNKEYTQIIKLAGDLDDQSK